MVAKKQELGEFRKAKSMANLEHQLGKRRKEGGGLFDASASGKKPASILPTGVVIARKGRGGQDARGETSREGDAEEAKQEGGGLELLAAYGSDSD